ncbi:MAG TPA: DUF2062 domain-containing protein [Opitutus sp.]|nr:DUF2062 domain-containing protein [Opitutus sp.]
MLPDEHHEEKAHRHGRRRRAKRLLRFVPRRAMLHKYPLIGRFAEFARKRSFLWSFKSEHMRPAFYAGSILSLLPVMGVQLPLALLLSLLLRGNFMVMGGLQFITNPFTAAPIYYATHQLGAKIIEVSGFGHSIEVVEETPEPHAAEPIVPPHLEPARTVPPADPAEIHWTRRVGTAINALVIGGVVTGALLGLALDLLWKLTWANHHQHPKKRPRRHPPHSHSTPPHPPTE